MRYRAEYLMNSDTLRMTNIGLDEFKEINKHELVKRLAAKIFENIKVDIVDVEKPVSGLRSEIDIFVIDKKEFETICMKMSEMVLDVNQDSRKEKAKAIAEIILNV